MPPPTTHQKFRTYLFAGLATAILCALASFVSAQVQQPPDLSIANFSVYSTLPDVNNFKRVAISFSVFNVGIGTAPPSTTRVIVGNSGVSFSTPALKAGASAYISRPMRTSETELAITVLADAFNKIPLDDKSNNELKHTANLRREAGRWISIGPSKIQDVSKTFGPTLGVGRVTTIAVDPRSPLIIYLGATGSGLWKSSGSTWFPIADALPTLQIDAIGIYPRNPNRVVIATPRGVFESTDGGEVWSQLTSENLNAVGSGGGAFLIENTDNPALYLSTMNGLRVSTDGGHMWNTVLRPNSRILSLQFSTRDPTHLLASTIDPPLVFEAKDRGLTQASWHVLTGIRGSSALPLPFPPNSAVWIAESGTHRWVSIRDVKSDDKMVELWRSTNFQVIDGFTEHSWERVSLTGNCGKPARPFSYLFAHPTDSSLVFKGGVDLCRSEKRGDGLKPVSGIHVDQHVIMVAPSDPNLMFFGNDGGIYRSRDKGKTMEFIGEGLNNTEFYKIDTEGQSPKVVVGGSQDQGTATWNGFSPIWDLVSAGNIDLGDSSLVAFDRADMKGIFEIGQSTQQIRLLKPGGGDLSLKNSPEGILQGRGPLADCITITSSTPVVRESMVSTGDEKPRLLITCHGIWVGPPWQQMQPGPSRNGDVKRLKLHATGQLVAVTEKGHVFFGRLKPIPSLPEVFHTPTEASPSAITFADKAEFYVSMNSGSNGSIHHLTCKPRCIHEDVPLSNPFPVVGEITALTVDPLDPKAIVAAVRNRGVFRAVHTSGSNWTWTIYNNGLPFGVTVTDLQPQLGGGIIAATYGRGAFQLFSRIQARPPNQQAQGHVTSVELDREDFDPSVRPSSQAILVIGLDSKPGFIFTARATQTRFAAIARTAMKTKRIVTIEFRPNGPQRGIILSLK